MTRFPFPLALLAFLLLGGCVCDSRYHPRTPHAEALAMFAKAEGGEAASVVLDFEAMRASGLIPRHASERSFLGEALIAALPVLAVRSDDDAERAFYAHAAVATWLLREWEAWPDVLRTGAFLPKPSIVAPERMLTHAVLLLAVDADAERTRGFLDGVASLDRAARVPRLESVPGHERVGSAPDSAPDSALGSDTGSDLCLRTELLSEPLCARGGNGWLAVGTSAALDGITPGVVAPAAHALSPAGPPPIVTARLSLPGFSRGRFSVKHTDGLRLHVEIEARDESEATELENSLRETADQLLANFEAAQALLEPAVYETRAALEGDTTAPEGLRLLVYGLTASDVLDRDGHLRALTESLRIERNGLDLTASALIPDPLAKRVLEEATSIAALSSLSLAGALLLPRVSEFQCRARQAEVKASLQAAYVMQQARLAQGHDFPVNFDAIGFEAQEGSRYTYCMGDECLLCTHPTCANAPPMNPCHEALLMHFAEEGENLFICAFGDASGDGDPDSPDIWIMGDSGIPLNIADDCAPWR